MFSFFSKKPKVSNLAWLGVDMHSHILPGIDDGAETVDQSLKLLERLHALGLSTFHFTPHVFAEMYPNTWETVAAAYNLLLEKLPAGIKTSFAAEYMVDSGFEKKCTDSNQLLLLPNQHILVEMSYIQESHSIDSVLFDLQVQGLNPILAHPERYVYYQGDLDKIRRFREAGVLLQVNLLSLIGYYGNRERKAAKWLAEQGWIDLVGTDVHHERHVNALELGLQQENLTKVLQNCTIKNAALFA